MIPFPRMVVGKRSYGGGVMTLFEAVGGEQYFRGLVDDFYDRVDTDPTIRPLYPEDLTESRERTALFLIQYWGGPTTYSDQRGHPRLRMRHMPFPIGMVERNAWLRHMTAAVFASGVDHRAAEQMNNYFANSSLAMINQE